MSSAICAAHLYLLQYMLGRLGLQKKKKTDIKQLMHARSTNLRQNIFDLTQLYTRIYVQNPQQNEFILPRSTYRTCMQAVYACNSVGLDNNIFIL